MFNPNPAQPVRKRLCRALGLLIFLFAVASEAGAQSQAISTCSGNPFFFTQPGAPAGTTYTWSAPSILPAAGAITGGSAETSDQSSISQALENTTAYTATATYQVTTSQGNTFQLVVTVYPLPELSTTATPAAVCSGTNFSYAPGSLTPNTTFTWSRLAVPGISNVGNTGTGNPAEVLNNTTTAPVTVVYKYTAVANGCAKSDQIVSVDVNPIPFLSSSLTPGTVCSGSTFNYVPTSPDANSFTWVRGAVAGISNPQGASNGNPEVHEVLDNTTLLPVRVTYRYTLTNNTLTCSQNVQDVSVTIMPSPVVSSRTITAVCSGNAFLSSPTNVPEGTTYTWSNPQPLNSTAQLSGGSAVSVGRLFISQALTNNGATTETLRYTVTPSAGSCDGSTFFVDVPVNTTTNSRAVLTNPSPNGVCSGGTFNFTPASTTAVSYAWKRFYNGSISQAASNSGVSTDGIIAEQLTNSSTIQTTVYYAYTLTAPNGCTNTQQLAVPINPPTTLNSTTTPVAVCSNTPFVYTPTSATPGTVFGWTRAAVTGILNSPDAGSGAITERLINNTTAPLSVVYRYALTTPNGCTNQQNVTVLVNPTPLLTSPANPTAICSGTAFTYTPSSSTGGAGFAWTRDAIPNLANAPGSNTGNTLQEVLVDTAVVPVVVTYKYTVTANSCSNTQLVTVVVNPTPRVSLQEVTTCSKVAIGLPQLNVPSGTTYSWGPPAITPSSSVIGANAITLTGQTTFSQLLTNQTLNPASVVYAVTPVSGACTGVSFKVDLKVNPVPTIANQTIPAVCSGVAFSYANGAVPTGTTYTWSSPVQSPLNSLTGGSAEEISQSRVSQSLSSTNNQSNTASYTVTPSAYGCSGNTFVLTVPVNPTPALNSITDTICSTGSFALAPTAPSNTTYSWGLPVSKPFGAIVGSTAQSNSSTISQALTNATNANAQAVYSVIPKSGSCEGPAFDVTVTVGVPLPFTADQAALICSGTSFEVTPATARPGTTYTWSVPTVVPAGSIVGASAMPNAQTLITQRLDNLIDRRDTVTYTILPYNTGCRGNIFKAVVQVMPLPKAAITGSPVICRTPTDTLTVTFVGTGPWSFDYTNGPLSGTQTGITTSPYKWVVPSIPDLASRTLAISRVNDLACLNIANTGNFTQRVNPLPVAQMTSLHGIYVCNNIPDTMLVQSLRQSDILSYQWTRNGTPINGAVKDSIVTSQTGRYNVTMVNQYGCTDTVAAPIAISVVKQPMLKITLDSYCVDRQIQFTNLTDTLGIGETAWTWNFGDTTGSNLFNPTHTYLRAGKHHLRLTATQAFCAGYTTTAEAILDVQTPIAGVTMPSVSTYKGKVTPLAVRQLPGYAYQWTPSRGIDKPDSASVNFDLSATQQYAVKLISTGGCVTTDSLLVRVFDDKLQNIFVPKSFTPNNDGINDKLYPYLSGIKEFKYFKIVNRFGKTMFESTDPDMGWNGSVNGVAQPMGIYLWISAGTALDGTMIENKGQTLLLR